MELAGLFTEQKWNILKLLSEEEFSPLQLSQRSKTTMANISQQLRLLEASSLVGKRKIPNRDRGKPRTLFHIRKDFGYLIQVRQGFAEKKLVELDDFHKIFMTIWFLNDRSLHYFLEKWLFKIEPFLSQIEGILINEKMQGEKIAVTIVSKKAQDLKKKISAVEIRDNEGTIRVITADCVDLSQLKSLASNHKGIFSQKEGLLVLYDPEKSLSFIQQEINQQGNLE